MSAKVCVFTTRKQQAQIKGFGDLMTVAEVAEALKVSARTVRNLIAREELPAVKIGHRWYVIESRLAKFLEE